MVKSYRQSANSSEYSSKARFNDDLADDENNDPLDFSKDKPSYFTDEK